MSFCAKCGRERNGDARFCGTCGAEFSDSAATGDSPAASAGDTLAAGSTADATRIDRPAEPSDPFASWYQPQGTPAGGFGAGDTDEHWQPTQTVGQGANQAPGYPPPAPQAPGYPPVNPAGGYSPGTPPPAPPYPPFAPGPPSAGPGPGRRRSLFIALAVIVVLAAGGGAYALATTLGKHSAAQPPASPSVSAPASTPPATAPASPSGSPTLTPTPSPTSSLVSIDPSVTSGAAPAAETLLSHYFHGINSHHYAEYASTLTPAEQANQPQSNFDSGYSTTADSGMTLTSLSGSGNLTATVTFTSRQDPGQSIDKSACNDWTVNFYLVPAGSGYLIGPAPAGYHAQHSDC